MNGKIIFDYMINNYEFDPHYNKIIDSSLYDIKLDNTDYSIKNISIVVKNDYIASLRFTFVNKVRKNLILNINISSSGAIWFSELHHDVILRYKDFHSGQHKLMLFQFFLSVLNLSENHKYEITNIPRENKSYSRIYQYFINKKELAHPNEDRNGIKPILFTNDNNQNAFKFKNSKLLFIDKDEKNKFINFAFSTIQDKLPIFFSVQLYPDGNYFIDTSTSFYNANTKKINKQIKIYFDSLLIELL